MSRVTHSCGLLLIAIAQFLPLEAVAVSAPVNLNDFSGDPEVTITPDGVSAIFSESQFSTVVLLTNDPFLGDPFIIVPGPSTFLTFDFDFNEASGDADTLSAYLFYAPDGPISGVLDQFTVESKSSGTARFDLSDYYFEGEVLQVGLQFELIDLSLGSLDSTATISNLALTQVVPVPAAVWLFGSGIIGLIGIARRNDGIIA